MDGVVMKYDTNPPRVDGSGWVKVKAGFKEGMVPASYIELSEAEPESTPPPATSAAPIVPSSTRPASTYSSESSASAPLGGPRKKGPAVAPRRGAKKLT